MVEEEEEEMSESKEGGSRFRCGCGNWGRFRGGRGTRGYHRRLTILRLVPGLLG